MVESSEDPHKAGGGRKCTPSPATSSLEVGGSQRPGGWRLLEANGVWKAMHVWSKIAYPQAIGT